MVVISVLVSEHLPLPASGVASAHTGKPQKGSAVSTRPAVPATSPKRWDALGQRSGGAIETDPWGFHEAKTNLGPSLGSRLTAGVSLTPQERQAGLLRFDGLDPIFRQDGNGFYMSHRSSSLTGHKRVESAPTAGQL